MSKGNIRSAARPDWDQALADIANYVCATRMAEFCCGVNGGSYQWPPHIVLQ